MNNPTTRNNKSPLILTLIVATWASFIAYRLYRLAVYYAVPHHRVFEASDFIGAIVNLALLYFLLSGKNWARIVIATFSIFYALVCTLSIVIEPFSIRVIIILAYVLFVFGTLTLNQKVVSYFRKQKGVQQGGPGYPPQGVGSPDP